MALSKETTIHKIETIRTASNYFLVQVNETTEIFEDDVSIAVKENMYLLTPDHDTSTITDSTVLAQFNAVMTDEVKNNYQQSLVESANTLISSTED